MSLYCRKSCKTSKKHHLIASSILLLMSDICTVENHEILFSHIRTVLEILVLYSIETSDLKWISDHRAIHLSQSIETLPIVGFQKSQLPPVVDQSSSTRHCLRISVHLKLRSRVEQCRAQIIQALVGLSETMRLEGPLSVYDSRDPTISRTAPLSGRVWDASATSGSPWRPVWL